MKSPGDGRTYLVGTLDIRDARESPAVPPLPAQPSFSNVVVGLPPQAVSGVASGFYYGGTTRQVVILQCIDAAGAIQWQRYFYGATDNLLGAGYRRDTNARGISVWVGETDLETRIAICGETQDDVIPLSQSPGGWVQIPPTIGDPSYTGYVAVYDGTGDLKWTHHFFGAQPPSASGANTSDCAITDVSIRTEGAGSNLRDVVTYCGISSFGTATTGATSLEPKHWFASPATGMSAGNTHLGTLQWDGIVGRISRDHLAAGTTTTEFHSVVGSLGQDGLFGIAELDGQRVVVVGGTRRPSAGVLEFPFTMNDAAQGSRGVGCVLVFNATGTRAQPPTALVLEESFPLGTQGFIATFSPAWSIAYDVLVQPDLYPTGVSSPSALYHVVGATNDPNFFAASGIPAEAIGHSLNTLRGPSDGFLVTVQDLGGSLGTRLFLAGGFVGDNGEDGLTGVASWNEHTDHIHVTGFSQTAAGDLDVVAASLFVNNAMEWPLVTGPVDPLLLMRLTTFGGSNADRPAVMGTSNATQTGANFGGLVFDTGLGGTAPFGSGSVAGGGITVDPRGRASVVGGTKSSSGAGYPVTGAPFVVGRAYQGSADAVRTELDMLPVGVGRTDGTGSLLGVQPTPVVPAPVPPVGASGGTTPACELSPFGRRINGTSSALPRMLIDFEGVNAAGQTPSILVVRPPHTGLALDTVLQFGFPAASPVNWDGIEFWLQNLNAQAQIYAPWFGWTATPAQIPQTSWRFRFTIPLAASSSPPISAQLFVLNACDATTWTCTGCTDGLTIVASPALYFDW